MNCFPDSLIRAARLFLLTLAVVFTFGCATAATHTAELPPLLTQDELLRPYQKVANITVTRERYGSLGHLTADDYQWAYQALREEASKLGADAVILPEIKMDQQSYLVFPVSEIRAKAVAIKFR
jgi:hypothetical protein